MGAHRGRSGTALRKRLIRKELVSVAACALLLCGCGSTAAIVKEAGEGKQYVANAFTRALAFSSEKIRPEVKPKTPPSPSPTYPPLPSDDTEPRVRKFIREYAYSNRATMKEYLARAEKFLPMLKATAREHGLPEDISYLVLLESGGNPEARSPANALGMWQFMPATARSYGLRVDSWVDERLDPKKSTKAAMLYLKELYGMFGCWRLALSAYNSGENKLNKVLCQEDACEYDQICSSRRLKRETREFFPRFQAIALVAKNAAKYGFSPVKEEKYAGKEELLTVEGSYSVETLAKAARVDSETVAELNPALIRGMTPPSGSPHSLRVPAGKKQLIAKTLAELPKEPEKHQIVHVVNKGDSVSKILHRYRVSRALLAGMNPDVNLRKKLRRGDKIVIPAFDSPKKRTTKRDSHLSAMK